MTELAYYSETDRMRLMRECAAAEEVGSPVLAETGFERSASLRWYYHMPSLGM